MSVDMLTTMHHITIRKEKQHFREMENFKIIFTK